MTEYKVLLKSKTFARLNNYKMRLFMMMMVFTWIVAFVFFGIFFYREKELKAEGINARLQVYNAQLLAALDNGFESGLKYIDYISANDSVRFTVLDSLGAVIYDTRGIKKGTYHGNRMEVKKAQEFGMGFTQRRESSVDSCHYFYSAMDGGRYIVRSSIPYTLTVTDALKNETMYLWTILIISLVLSLLAFFASRQFGQNVAKLRNFAALAEKGELAKETLMDFPNDELGEISRHIINIYNKERVAIRERDCYYENLINEEYEKTRIKHELTNNINHELKTPVHAIQGCLETIVLNGRNMTMEQINTFVSRAYEQVVRLCSLLNDVSVITRITEAPLQIEKVRMDIIPIFRRLETEMELLPLAQRMRMNFSLPEKMIITANERLMESVFQNLVGNSLNHSGGRDIFITLLEDDDDFYVLSYSDNGVGIEESHFPRVFERFYRIDDGRSRKTGGTGLGLAIVKNAVSFQGGDIKVQTRQGGGLEFIIMLKK